MVSEEMTMAFLHSLTPKKVAVDVSESHAMYLSEFEECAELFCSNISSTSNGYHTINVRNEEMMTENQLCWLWIVINRQTKLVDVWTFSHILMIRSSRCVRRKQL